MQFWVATPVTLALVYRSYSHSSLTVPGIIVAAATAIVHALPPSPTPFILLIVFFLLGTSATKVKKDVKASLTLSSTGHRNSSSNTSRVDDWFGGGWNKHKPVQAPGKEKKPATGGQEPRSVVQVLANSGWSSLLCLLHVYIFGISDQTGAARRGCFTSVPARDLILAGVVANYAAVTADTLSSELGILSKAKPRFILDLRPVPPGTNGGVTAKGLLAGFAGALTIGAVSVALLPDLWSSDTCTTTPFKSASLLTLIPLIGSLGTLGSLLDSLLGATLQASVLDRRSGKVVEAHNGGRVLVSGAAAAADAGENKKNAIGPLPTAGRVLGSGRDILDNNQVNFLMAGIMTVCGMLLAARAWDLPLRVLWSGSALGS